jgi:NADH-quinone oxidoreductase subunit J
MMLDIDIASMREGFTRYLPVGAVVAGVMVVEFVLVMMSDRFSSQSLPRPAGHGPDYSNTRELGLVLYTDYVFVFEVAGLILLVAIVSAIALTLRRRQGTRYQSPSKQVKVSKSERLRIVSMPTEKRSEMNK